MKKTLLGLLAVLMALSMCACTRYEDGDSRTYAVERDGVEYVVDTGRQTISDGTYTYQYSFSGDSSQYQVNITYPDGSAYFWRESSSGGAGGWSADPDLDLWDASRDKYADSDVLRDILVRRAPRGASDLAKVLLAVFIMVIGAVGIFSPSTTWYLSYGWRYKNAEPSDAALLFGRVGGVLVVIAGILVLFL